jgi:hypothetical protein
VLNNPLSMTDPSGNSWLKDNWVTVVVAVVVAVVTWGVGSYFSGAALAAGQSTTFATLGSVSAAAGTMVAVPVTATLTAAGMAVTGAIAGFVGGGLGAALSGGSGSDILRGALVGAVQGAISGGILHEMGIAAQEADFFSVDSAKWMAGHGIVGGASNEAMGGKFADGFFSAVAGAAIAVSGIYKTLDLGNPGGAGDNAAKMFGRTAISAIAGGTAAEIGGGKFANGAYTAAFQHLTGEFAPVGIIRKRATGPNAGIDAMLSEHVYGESEDLPEGYVLKERFSDSSGGSAALYSNGHDNVLAFAGTSLFSGGNWIANLSQAFGFESAQYNWAKDLALQVNKSNPNLRYTGHSLGGGLAAAVAIVNGGRANVYNAAGVHPNTLGGFSPSNGSVYYYFSDFDVLRYINYITPARVPGNHHSLGFAGYHGISRVVDSF